MEHKLLKFKTDFRVGISTKSAQIAEMTIKPGDSEGDAENNHRGSDQWLFVISGTGVARIEGKTISLKRGSLLLIERKERHQIKSTGRTPLKTLNVYTPPAYTKGGNERPKGRRTK